MPKQVSEETEMTVLADKVDELISKHEVAMSLDALLTVLTWKLVDVAQMVEKPPDEIIDKITIELKDAAKQIIAAEEEHERLGTLKPAEQGKMLQ